MRWPLLRVAVAESSMEPTLSPGDWLLVWRGTAALGRWLGQRDHGQARIRVRPGQLVVVRHPQRRDLLLVKRAATCGPDGWWLISDSQHEHAVDSRRFGAVTAELIEGRVLARYWPLRRTSLISARAGRMPGPCV